MRHNECYKRINEALPLENVIVFVQSYRGGVGNMYIMWCKDTNI